MNKKKCSHCGKETGDLVDTAYGSMCSKDCFVETYETLSAGTKILKVEKTLEQVLEEFKQAGHYGVQVYFGENIGCDDFDVPMEERSLTITGVPVGVLGGARVLWKGNLVKARAFSFSNSSPVQVSNPPGYGEISDHGFYVWGSDSAINSLVNRGAATRPEQVQIDRDDTLNDMEDKFVVFNKIDIKKYVPAFMLGGMQDVVTEIEEGRKADGKTIDHRYLVINTDEKYAPEVVNILKREGHWGGTKDEK